MSTPPARRPTTGVLIRLLIWIALALAWEAAYRIIGWRFWVFPAPSHVLDATLDMLGVRSYFGDPATRGWPGLAVRHGHVLASPLLMANLASGLRLLVGFTASIVVGTALGGAMWRSKPVDQFIGPVTLGLQTLPSVCWVPLAVLVFGYNEYAVQAVLILGSMFAVSISVRDGLRTIPPLYHRAGLMLGASGLRGIWYVLLPASLPVLASGLRQGFSFAWRSLMGAELVFGPALSPPGLGVLLQTGRDIGGPAQVIAVMMVMVLIGMAADRILFGPLEDKIHRRFGLSRA